MYSNHYSIVFNWRIMAIIEEGENSNTSRRRMMESSDLPEIIFRMIKKVKAFLMILKHYYAKCHFEGSNFKNYYLGSYINIGGVYVIIRTHTF
jgi:hypothetical protein